MSFEGALTISEVFSGDRCSSQTSAPWTPLARVLAGGQDLPPGGPRLLSNLPTADAAHSWIPLTPAASSFRWPPHPLPTAGWGLQVAGKAW